MHQRGYSLVALVVLMVVLSIAVTVALPMWSTVVRREREKELLFRGWQYAEAIRVFQIRFGRLPVRLEELYEVKPRSIRQLWEDPLSDSGEWEPIMSGTPSQTPAGGPAQGQVVGGGVGPSGARAGGPRVRSSTDRDDDGPTAFGPSAVGQAGPDGAKVGPIEGVRPTAKGAALRSFLGNTEYSQWEFRVTMLAAPPVGADGVPRSPRIGALSLSPTESLGVEMTPGSPPQPGKRPGDTRLRRTPDGS
jgi:type II secretory pathway pseudopilin PulG